MQTSCSASDTKETLLIQRNSHILRQNQQEMCKARHLIFSSSVCLCHKKTSLFLPFKAESGLVPPLSCFWRSCRAQQLTCTSATLDDGFNFLWNPISAATGWSEAALMCVNDYLENVVVVEWIWIEESLFLVLSEAGCVYVLPSFVCVFFSQTMVPLQ